MRIGFASDIHKLVIARKFVLAGVAIPSKVGELAHSDGDVVYHAVSEAILGALALGDLGKHFPATDEYKDIDSSFIVKKVVFMMLKKGYVVNNVDVSITLEKPKLKDYIELMRENVARLLEVELDQVSVKAGTNEKMGEVGRGEAIEASSIILLRKRK